MDETETTTHADGPETATQSSEDTRPSAANNYEGIHSSDGTSPAEQQTDEPDLSALPEEGEGTAEVVDPWAGYVDFELDGQIHKIPEALKDGFYRTKDYTQKTQALAEEKRQIAAQAENLKRVTDISEQELNMRVELNGMVGQLERFEQVDWEAFEQQEPLQAASEFRKFQQLKDTFNRKHGELTTAQTERSQIVEREIASRIDATTKYAYEHIPGMSPKLDADITSFAIKEMGYNPDTLKKSYNPQVYKTLFLAYLGHQTLATRQTQAKTPAVKPQTQPLTVVSAKTGSTGRKSLTDLASTDYEGFRAARLAQMAKKAQS